MTARMKHVLSVLVVCSLFSAVACAVPVTDAESTGRSRQATSVDEPSPHTTEVPNPCEEDDPEFPPCMDDDGDYEEVIIHGSHSATLPPPSPPPSPGFGSGGGFGFDFGTVTPEPPVGVCITAGCDDWPTEMPKRMRWHMRCMDAARNVDGPNSWDTFCQTVYLNYGREMGKKCDSNFLMSQTMREGFCNRWWGT